MPTMWIVASLVPRRAHSIVSMQLHQLRSMSMKTVDSSVAKIAEVPRAAVVARAIGVLKGEACWGPPVLLLCLWEKVLAEGIPLGSRSCMFALQVAAEPGYWGQMHSELPQRLHLLAPVSEVWEYVDLSGNWGLGLWYSLQRLRLQRTGAH